MKHFMKSWVDESCGIPHLIFPKWLKYSLKLSSYVNCLWWFLYHSLLNKIRVLIAPQTFPIQAADCLLNHLLSLALSHYFLVIVNFFFLNVGNCIFSSLLALRFGIPTPCKAFSRISLANSYGFSWIHLFLGGYVNFLLSLKTHQRFFVPPVCPLSI